MKDESLEMGDFSSCKIFFPSCMKPLTQAILDPSRNYPQKMFCDEPKNACMGGYFAYDS